DSWVHPLMMGLEEHLLSMFRDDFEFHDNAAASHLAAHSPAPAAPPAPEAEIRTAPAATETDAWTSDAEKELRKIPFFVRGKARRNTERYAAERGIHPITVDTLYDAKAHFSR
ncbi:MAG: ferredoxin:protochlorophyllide reductase (ATP-dependent) subunit B, partial [Gemmatimonadetes bacterium]|nr:ferredoxin:protochlorophyllide reductase (ATP-dependent) subunit B [Gemmatimonadota bacterium]